VRGTVAPRANPFPFVRPYLSASLSSASISQAAPGFHEKAPTAAAPQGVMHTHDTAEREQHIQLAGAPDLLPRKG